MTIDYKLFDQWQKSLRRPNPALISPDPKTSQGSNRTHHSDCLPQKTSPPESLTHQSLKPDTDQYIPSTHYWLNGDLAVERRVLVTHIGLDLGTKTIVLAFGEQRTISEVNGYFIFERPSPFIEGMLNAEKLRPDGTSRPARWIKLNDKIVVLGRDAEEIAHSMNDTLLRPMAQGSVAADEDAMTIMSSIIQGLLDAVERELGKFDKEVSLCYCTTAQAINGDLNLDYHQRVVDLIVQGYQTKSKLKINTIKESHAIVLHSSPQATGIGISWGAGTVTVSYVNFGLEIYSFSVIGAGDWIDTQVASRHGYTPSIGRKTKSKETPTTVCRRKEQLDLTPGKAYSDRLDLDITLHYDILINNVLDQIVIGFVENGLSARLDGLIDIYFAGGTSAPVGFTERFEAALKARYDQLPFQVGSVHPATEPLQTVAYGCLAATKTL